MRRLPDAGAAPRARVAQRQPVVIAAAVATRRVREHRPHPAVPASLASSGSPTISATSADLRPPGDGPRTTTPALGLAADTHGAIAAAAAHDRTSAGATTTTRSAASSTRLHRICRSTGQVADHCRAAAAAGVDHRAKRHGIDITAGATARQNADSMPLRQCVPQRCVAEPTALQREIRPAQACLALAAQDQVDAPAPRVGVDEQRIGRRLRQRGREDRGAGPAAACDHADDRAAPILVATTHRRRRTARPSTRRHDRAAR